VTLTLASTWAYGANEDPVLARFMSAKLLADQDWSGLVAASTRGVLTSAHLDGVRVPADELVDLAAHAEGSHSFAELLRSQLLELEPEELTEAPTSRPGVPSSMMRLLLSSLPEAQRRTVLLDVSAGVLRHLDWAWLAEGLELRHDASMPRTVLRLIEDEVPEAEEFLRRLDLRSCLRS
jgi:hypothetical protein